MAKFNELLFHLSVVMLVACFILLSNIKAIELKNIDEDIEIIKQQIDSIQMITSKEPPTNYKENNVATIKHLWTHRLYITKYIDGDTVKGDVDLGHDVIHTNQTIRFQDIDTPEKTGETKEIGKAVAEVVKKLIIKLSKENDDVIWFKSTAKKDSFGRMIGYIYFGDMEISLNEMILDLGLANEYIPGLFKANNKFDASIILNEIDKLQPYLDDTTGKVKLPKLKISSIVENYR